MVIFIAFEAAECRARKTPHQTYAKKAHLVRGFFYRNRFFSTIVKNPPVEIKQFIVSDPVRHEANGHDNRRYINCDLNTLIEELIDRLEDYFIFRIYVPPAYTPAQLIKRAHTSREPDCIQWPWSGGKDLIS